MRNSFKLGFAMGLIFISVSCAKNKTYEIYEKVASGDANLMMILETLDEKTQGDLTTLMIRELDQEKSKMAYTALTEMKRKKISTGKVPQPIVQSLINELSNENQKIIAHAQAALSRLNKSSIPLLSETIKTHKDPMVRARAVFCFWELRNEDMVDEINEIISLHT